MGIALVTLVKWGIIKKMGRKRKYFTEEEKKDAQRKWQMEHYQRNKEDICKKARERYQKKKKEIIDLEKRKRLYGE